MSSLRAAVILSVALPLTAGISHSRPAAPPAERFSLRGNEVAIYNVAGKVTIERGTGSDVVVEASRGGSDGNRIKFEQRTVDGRPSLCVVYPDEKIVYPQRGHWGNSETSTSDRDCRTERGSRISVSSGGRGLEAWADLHILVPAGRDVRVTHMVGDVDIASVDARLSVDGGAAKVTSHDTRGPLTIGSGSGGVTVTGHNGELNVAVGSGGVQLDRVDGKVLSVHAGSGGVRGNDVRSADIAIHSGSGGVTLSVPSSFGAHIDCSSGSGGISNDLPLRDMSSNRRHSELHGIIGDGHGRVVIDVGSGGVRLRRVDRMG